jgi:hypothetical protein
VTLTPSERFLVCEIADRIAADAVADLRHRLRAALTAHANDGTEQRRLIEDPAVRRAVEQQYKATITVDTAVEVIMALVERGELR